VHLLTASAFALVWLVVILGTESIRMHRGLIDTALAWKGVLGWYFVLGVSLYGLVTFFSYTVRTGARLREQERLAAEARLAALRNQLNPHFLFNSLHSLSVLVRRDQAAAQVAIEQLGDMLRYTLSEADADEVPLSEEWRFTKTYLALEQIRFGERLAIEDQLAPSTMSCLVPSFTLQILTENAVRHGIGPQSSGGSVQLRSRLDGERLVLEVADTGAGGNPTNGGNGGGGRGLKLLRERLAALYGAAGRLDIRTASHGGFTASVSLPVRHA
jgi:LytS/YehU family sensor histidine kinase